LFCPSRGTKGEAECAHKNGTQYAGIPIPDATVQLPKRGKRPAVVRENFNIGFVTQKGRHPLI
jgi:hypothetical protein